MTDKTHENWKIFAEKHHRYIFLSILAIISFYIDFHFGIRYVNFYTVYHSPKGGEYLQLFLDRKVFIGAYIKMAFFVCALNAIFFCLFRIPWLLSLFILGKLAFFYIPFLFGVVQLSN